MLSSAKFGSLILLSSNSFYALLQLLDRKGGGIEEDFIGKICQKFKSLRHEELDSRRIRLSRIIFISTFVFEEKIFNSIYVYVLFVFIRDILNVRMLYFCVCVCVLDM